MNFSKPAVAASATGGAGARRAECDYRPAGNPRGGVLTAPQRVFVDGANRAMFRFTLLNHCAWTWATKGRHPSTDRIRQDVSRSPGVTVSCSQPVCRLPGGMDPLAQAYYEFLTPGSSFPAWNWRRKDMGGWSHRRSAGQST